MSCFFSFFLCLSTPSFSSIFFFFNDTATTEIYTLSLHDALPIFSWSQQEWPRQAAAGLREEVHLAGFVREQRSEERTSELQSHLNLVCRLLLEKKKRRERQDSTGDVAVTA